MNKIYSKYTLVITCLFFVELSLPSYAMDNDDWLAGTSSFFGPSKDDIRNRIDLDRSKSHRPNWTPGAAIKRAKEERENSWGRKFLRSMHNTPIIGPIASLILSIADFSQENESNYEY